MLKNLFVRIRSATGGQQLQLIAEQVEETGSFGAVAIYCCPVCHNRGVPGVQVPAYQTFAVGKKLAGRLLEGREWNQLPQATMPSGRAE